MNTSRISIFLLYLFLLTPLGLTANPNNALVTADKMELDKKKGTTLLIGNVIVLIESEDVSLKSGKLKLKRDEITQKIVKAEIDKNVILKKEDKVFTGDHMFYDRHLSIAELKGNLKIRSKNSTINAEHILYYLNSEKGKITAKKGEVVQFKVDRSPTEKEVRATLEGQAKEILLFKKEGKLNLLQQVFIKDLLRKITFKTDNATLFFNQFDEVEEIIAEGNFYLNQPGRYSVADRALFKYKTGKVILSGNVVVQDKDQVELKSSKVEMFLDVSKGLISGGENRPLQLKIPLPK
ncbi:MAG: hypothetical protein GY786_00995 [Proteobacteria bacterium]|nr:hypothetical protein [Pseudomonadota bacterium]